MSAGDIIGVGLGLPYSSFITGRGLFTSPEFTCFNALFSFAINFYSLQTARTLSSISADQTDVSVAALNSGKLSQNAAS